jgi:hypothetical protein
MSKLRLGSDPFAASAGVDALIKDTRSGTQNKHSNSELSSTSSKQSNTTKAGLRAGWTRATFIIREDQVEKLRDLAYWDRKDIKDVMAEALNAFLKGRKIEPRVKGGELVTQ